MLLFRSSTVLMLALLLSATPKTHGLDLKIPDVVKGIAAGTVLASGVYLTFFKNPDAAPKNKIEAAVDALQQRIGVKSYVQTVHRPVYKAGQHLMNNWMQYSALTAAFCVGYKQFVPLSELAHYLHNATTSFNPVQVATTAALKIAKAAAAFKKAPTNP